MKIGAPRKAGGPEFHKISDISSLSSDSYSVGSGNFEQASFLQLMPGQLAA